MAITDGDILSALSELKTDTSKIAQNISNMSEKDLHQIQQDLSTLVRISQGTQRSAENTRFQRERDERTRSRQYDARSSSQGTARSSFSRRSSYSGSRGFGSSFDGILDEFLGNIGKGLEDELKRSLADSPVSTQLRGYLKKFADDLGIKVSEIPSALGQELGKHILRNTRLGQSVTSTLQQAQDSILNSVLNTAKKGANRYAKSTGKNSYQDLYNEFVSNFRKTHGTAPKASQRAASEGVDAAKNVAKDATSKAASNAVSNAVGSAVGSAAGSAAAPMVSSMIMNAVGNSMPLLTAGTSAGVPLLAETASTTALASTTGGTLMAGMSAAGGEIASLLIAFPELAAVAAVAVVAIGALADAFGPAIKGVQQFAETSKKVSNRFYESQREMLKEEKKRIEADVRVMAETPFKIMEDAAQKWYDAWDNNLKKIGQTQGYTKADVQTLFSSYASRLRSEGLGSTISAADISSNLGHVLESGLSGKVAEEFAYQATLLGNAIPTQDFFGYADTYGQVVGNALAKGMSKDAAIQEANRQMQQHASNLLYAGRNISDGIASALKDGSSLFADAVKIANTARTGDSSMISAVLTSAAAEVSAIAPDLASDLISNIVQAAVGGNNSDLVALRSMAGIGASNTAFLQALATNPQQVFAAMFSNLATMQNLDKNNYMEVAESLSQTFGISASAFARIDFTSLAQAISSMQVNSAALSENMKLLKSGETTTSPEMMRMQQVNQMILDEGLSYVLDSEAGRAIQQHMWDQELANEIMERQYSVDFAGSAKEMIQGIFETIHNILNFLNPFAWVGKLANLVATGAEYDAQKADLRAILEAGKVGTGNANAFRALTNYNGTMMNNVPSLMDMLGLASKYQATHGALTSFNTLWDGTLYSLGGATSQKMGALNANLQTALTSRQSGPGSKYTWGFVGKSLAKTLSSTPMTGNALGSAMVSASDAIRKQQATKMNKLLGSMDDALAALNEPFAIESGSAMSYDEWKAEAMSKYKISDFDEALSEVGLTEAEVRGQFEATQAQASSKYDYQRNKEQYEYYTEDFPYYSETQLDRMQQIIDLLTNFYNDWTNKWLNEAWTQNWVGQSWGNDWLTSAWNHDWLVSAWNNDWIANAWTNSWLIDAWYNDWMKSWREDWLDASWNVNWLQNAWDKGWMQDAWGTGWLSGGWKTFLDAWTNRYVNYSVYTKETKEAYKAIDSVKNKDKKQQSGDAVLALAKALTDNTAELKDPQVQTNALLSQILIVLEALLQAENTSGGASLATTLAALGLGLTT